MKKLLILGLFLSFTIRAMEVSAGVPDQMTVLGGAAQPLGPTYGHPYVSVTSNAKNNFQVYNKSSVDLGVNVNNNTCTSENVDNFVVPATNGGVTIENVAIGRVICVRTLSGGSMSGSSVFVSRW